MKIFVRSTGGAFTRRQLIRFAYAGLRGPWYTLYRPEGEVRDCRILRITDASGRRVDFHGLLDVRPTAAAWALIQRLDSKMLAGNPVRVRKWFERVNAGAGRRGLPSARPWPGDDRRRITDRRRTVRVQLLQDLPHNALSLRKS